MKFRLCVAVLLIIVIGCNENNDNNYARKWEKMSLSVHDTIFLDTVGNVFIPPDKSLADYEYFFKKSFDYPENVWIQDKKSMIFHKILQVQKVSYGNEQIKMLRSISSIDSNREDHIMSFLFLENFGIIYQSNPSLRTYFLIKKIEDIKNNKVLIDDNYVKSIFPTTTIPELQSDSVNQ